MYEDPPAMLGGSCCALCVFYLDIFAHHAHNVCMNSRQVLQKLAQAGFVKVSQRGSHIKMRHSDGRVTIVPHPKKDLPLGTLRNIEAQAGVKF